MKYLAGALILAAVTAFAETAPAPVPATKERYHRVIFENEYLRVIDVQFKPGETTDYHVHSVASVVVYLTKSNNRSQTWGETTFLNRETTPGDSRYAPYDREPLTHRVTNTGTSLFHVFDIEILRQAPDPAAVAVARPTQTAVKWDDKLVRSSNLRLEPGARTEFAANACAHFLIGIEGTIATAEGKGAGAKRELKNSGYQYFPPHTRFEASNPGKEKSEGVLLELR